MEVGVVVAWWVLYVGAIVVGTPIVARVLPDAPDRGAFVAAPTTLGLLTFVLLWIGHVSFGPLALVVSVVAVLGIAAVAARDGVAVDVRPYAETIAVFSLAFGCMVLVRAAAPGIYPGGGEKFLDFGLLQSLLRAETLPPGDMWFAGERVVYHYGGHLTAAALAKLTGTPGRYAYALALSGFYAMAVTGVYGLAGAIASRRGLPRARSAAFAAFLYGFASNLLTPARVLATVVPRDALEGVAGVVERRSGGMYDLALQEIPIGPDTFSSWTASRVIPGTVNEFPLFAYLNGDLHAHMTSVPTMLVAAAILYAYWRTPAARVWRRRGLLLGALPVCLGLLLSVNTWSLPTGLGLTAVVVTLAPPSPWTLVPAGLRHVPTAVQWRPNIDRRRVVEEVGRVVGGVLLALAVGALAVAWVAPFVDTVLLAGIGNRHPAFFPDRSPLGPFLLVHGGFLLVFGPYLVREAGVTTRRIGAVLVAVPLLVALGAVSTAVAVAVVGPLVVAGWSLTRKTDLGFEGALLVAGAGLVVLVEFVYLADQAGPGRFNTVFKAYAQVWTFWAVAAGVGLASLTAEGGASLPPVQRDVSLPLSSETRSRAATAFAAVLVVSLSFYGAFALTAHFATADDLTIDGYEYVRESHPDEVAAIEWLNERPGRPHIVAAPGRQVFTWENPASSLTGLPTVVGWGHERIYRGSAAYDQRARDVEILFQTGEARSRAILLQKYDVEYVYVGPREKSRYDPGPLATEPGIDQAFTGGNVTIYAVNQTALTESASVS